MSIRIQNTADAVALLAPTAGHLEHEVLQALFLALDGTLIQHTILSRGTAEQTSLCIRTLLGSALCVGAQSIIVAHNHPNGNSEPSMVDLRATYRLMEAARVVGLTLIDHLVITGSDHSSMRAMGLLSTRSV